MALPAADHSTPPALRPLQRKPKTLSEAPRLFAAGGGTPLPADLGDRRGTNEADEQPAGGQGVQVTGQQAGRRSLDELLEPGPPDREVAAMAERIARRLSIRRRPRDRRADRGAGALSSVPYRHRSDDIDLDRTVEVLAERPVPEDTDIVVRERMRPRRAVALLVDVSGSMRGEKVRTAAATVGALSADLEADALALVAFWSDAAVLTTSEAPTGTHRLLDALLRIPARGLTNIHFALGVAHAELARSASRQRTAILLTDAVHNAGPDPRPLARRFPRLHVLLQTDGEHDTPLATDLARLGRGQLAPIRDHRDVAPALNRMMAG